MRQRQVLLNLQEFFPYQFSILAEQVSNYIAKIYREKYGLNKYEWRVVATIGQHQKISAKDICSFTQLEKMQVSRAINKLSSTGIVSQQTNDQDRRALSLELTAIGQSMYQEIIPLVLAQEQSMLSGLTKEECQQFLSLSKKLSVSLNNE